MVDASAASPSNESVLRFDAPASRDTNSSIASTARALEPPAVCRSSSQNDAASRSEALRRIGYLTKMSATVHELRAVEPAPDPSIVEISESLLARIKTGEILSIAVAAEIRGRCTASIFSLGSNGDVAHLVTSFERLKLRLLEIR